MVSGCHSQGSWAPRLNFSGKECACAGLAVSSNGVDWARGSGDVEGSSGPERAQEVGRVLTPNPDWWCFDTAHVTVSDVQVQMGVGWSVQGGQPLASYLLVTSGGHNHLKLS